MIGANAGVIDGATNLCRACGNGIEKYGGVLRHKRSAMPAIGQLTREFKAFGARVAR